jgi:hypothetical protein
VISQFHDSTTAGHPRILRTKRAINQFYWWPTIKQDVENYVKGCATCQSTKPRTSQPKPPPNPITAEHPTTPFGTIALDFITKLPTSNEYNTILTITDHDCSKAALFFPCKELITVEEVAKVYATHVFPHYGIPRKVISDRDPRFTSEFIRTLFKRLGIKQNLSSAYHPQTDSQSERTNQWLEQYLQIYGDFNQSDWAEWLLLAQYVHNSWMNETTKQSPFNLLIGVTPYAHSPIPKGQLTNDQCLEKIHKVQARAEEALSKAQDVIRQKRKTNYVPYNEGTRSG